MLRARIRLARCRSFWSVDVKVQFRRRLLPCMVILTAVCGMAQDPGDYDALGIDSGSTAQLWLNFDQQGNVNARLNLPEGSESSDELSKLLAQSLHCQPSAFKRPGGYPQTALPKNWSPAQRERYQKQIEEFSQRQLAGNCQLVLARQGG